ncbi:hypothetical protein FUA23_20305 [Neolewinella aurantiaca]|uniref:Uncharacterized protein n=1 Tax=Neolewinella aurantiaca TaxID=2602767 RepID=A0A5C7F801_9BACT|nr:hypothetical protein [Neolewinella aurantiaca]TXF85700.1 hypothetical protein FUA23_20305 [Neolewinella aurantiaca]
MKFYYQAEGDQLIGESGRLNEHIEWYPYTAAVAPFDVDVLIVFAGVPEDDQNLDMFLRYGRPVLRVGKIEPSDLTAVMEEYRNHIAGRARTNYEPIDCNFYDNFEAAIVQRRKVNLEYLGAQGETIRCATVLRDLKTHLTEEFVQLASGEWLRLDQIFAVDGVVAGDSCRF